MSIKEMVNRANEKQLAAHENAKVKKALQLSDPECKELMIESTLNRIEVQSDKRVVKARATARKAAMLEKATALLGLSDDEKEVITESKKVLATPPKEKEEKGKDKGKNKETTANTVQ